MGRNRKFGKIVIQMNHCYPRNGGKLRKIRKSVMEIAQMLEDLSSPKDKR